MPTLRQLVAKAKRFYPNSKPMRKQWVRQSMQLASTGRAALNNGGWRAGTRSQLLTTHLGG